jgi:hypothetical protein
MGREFFGGEFDILWGRLILAAEQGRRSGQEKPPPSTKALVPSGCVTGALKAFFVFALVVELVRHL